MPASAFLRCCRLLLAHASVKMGFKRLNIGIASPLRIHGCALDAPLTRQELLPVPHRVLRRAQLAKRTPLVLCCERFIANSFRDDDFVITDVRPNTIAARMAIKLFDGVRSRCCDEPAQGMTLKLESA